MRWLKRDALNRAWRTFLQGVLAVVVVPAATAGLDVLRQAILDGGIAGVDWTATRERALTVAAATVVMAVSAYLHRLKLDPSPIPSAQPPLPPGVRPGEAPAMKLPDVLR